MASRAFSLAFPVRKRTRQLFQYDGITLVAEYSTTILQRRYVHGPGSDDPIAWYEGSSVSNSTRRFLMADERGSITSVTDSTGAVLAINRYDEYGIPASTNLGRFGYTGQTWLPEIGMWHYKARIYSPTLGRFLQTDPIGYGDGMNWYAYVGGDPVNFVDPLGLSSAPPLPGHEDPRSGDGLRLNQYCGQYEDPIWGTCRSDPSVGGGDEDDDIVVTGRRQTGSGNGRGMNSFLPNLRAIEFGDMTRGQIDNEDILVTGRRPRPVPSSSTGQTLGRAGRQVCDAVFISAGSALGITSGLGALEAGEGNAAASRFAQALGRTRPALTGARTGARGGVLGMALGGLIGGGAAAVGLNYDFDPSFGVNRRIQNFVHRQCARLAS